MNPHKHAKFIKAWADGAEIQFYDKDVFEWRTSPNPSWAEDRTYRIKPEPKPDVVYYGTFDRIDVATQSVILASCFTLEKDQGDQIKITFDGETGKLKSAEVL